MAKETEERLIRALEFLKEPHGSTISTIVKAVNGEGPQVSLKKIVQTLRGCLENGILKVSDGRVKLKQMDVLSESKDVKQSAKPSERPKPANAEHGHAHKANGTKSLGVRSCHNKNGKGRTGRSGIQPLGFQAPAPEPPPDPGACPECPKCKKKRKPKCQKPKPKCPKPKPRCPKPKPRCKKRKPKCKPKRKPQKKCAKKVKIQPYCKKKKKCSA